MVKTTVSYRKKAVANLKLLVKWQLTHPKTDAPMAWVYLPFIKYGVKPPVFSNGKVFPQFYYSSAVSSARKDFVYLGKTSKGYAFIDAKSLANAVWNNDDHIRKSMIATSTSYFQTALYVYAGYVSLALNHRQLASTMSTMAIFRLSQYIGASPQPYKTYSLNMPNYSSGKSKKKFKNLSLLLI